MAEEGPLSASEIFWLINGGDGGDRLTAAQAASNDLWRELAECSDKVLDLARNIDEGWQGEAGKEAANAALPLAEASGVDSMLLGRAEESVTSQLTAFGDARNAIVPVDDNPPRMEATDIFVPGAYEKKVAAQEAAAQANIQAFAAYHQASTANGETMPASYASLTDPGASISLTESGTAKATGTAAGKDSAATSVPAPGAIVASTPTTRPSSTRTPRGTTGTPQSTPGRSVPDAPAASTAQSRGTGESTPGQGPDDTTQTANYTPQPIPSAPIQSVPYEFGPTGSPINHLNTGNGPWAPPNPYTGVGYRTGIPGSGSGTANPGTGSGARPGTGGGTVWRGSGANPGTGQTPAAPGRGTGAALPGEQATRGGTASGSGSVRGTTGAPVGAVGGGRGKGDDDQDRKPAPYLRNPDPDDTFAGPHEKVAPPVLGERKEG